MLCMNIIELSANERIEHYGSAGASSMLLANGHGESHAYFLRFDAGSIIGEHETGFGQLFVVIEGDGWIAGGDGTHVPIHAGQAAVFERGEVHSKGSDAGMSVIMIQMRNILA